MLVLVEISPFGEITELKLTAAVKQHVFELDISVDDSLRMQLLDGANHLMHDIPALR